MAVEGERVEMNYIPEVILKKKKSGEELALRRKTQLELRQKRSKLSKSSDFRTPEQFIREYRDKEIDLNKMKHRVKRSKPMSSLDSKLIFVCSHSREKRHASEDIKDFKQAEAGKSFYWGIFQSK